MLKHCQPAIISSLKNYSRTKLRKDIFSGVLVGVVALPLAIALSIASGMGPREGIITSIVAGFVAALFGGSNNQVSGVTGAFSVVILSVMAKFGRGGLLFAGFLAGILLIIMGIAKLGRFVKYIPFSVVMGFTAGIAFVIFIGQVKDFLGLDTALPAGSAGRVAATFRALSTLKWNSVLMGVFTIIVIYICGKISKKIPAMFAALVVCSLLNLLLQSATLGDVYGTVSVSLIADFSFFGSFGLGGILPLIRPAITIALLSAISALLSAVVADELAGSKHNPHAELVGQGLSNMMSSVFGGLPSTGAVARTCENVKNGGKTPVSALVHSLTMALWGFLLMPYAAYVPMATFAGILFVVCKNMVNFKKLTKIFHGTAGDILLYLSAFALTAFIDLVAAIFISAAAAFVIEGIKRRRHKKGSGKEIAGDTVYLKDCQSFATIRAMMPERISKYDINQVCSIDSDVVNALEAGVKGGRITEIHCKEGKIHNALKRSKEISKVLQDI